MKVHIHQDLDLADKLVAGTFFSNKVGVNLEFGGGNAFSGGNSD
jgi:hypothetical protein